MLRRFFLEDMVLSLTSDAEGSALNLANGHSSVTSDAYFGRTVLKSLEDDKAKMS